MWRQFCEWWHRVNCCPPKAVRTVLNAVWECPRCHAKFHVEQFADLMGTGPGLGWMRTL